MTSAVPDRDLARRLRARAPEAADELTALVNSEVDSLRSDTADHGWLRASVEANIDLLLGVMDRPTAVDDLDPPAGGVALARRLAQQGVPFYELVRGYQVAESFWLRLCTEELAARGDEDLAAAYARASTLVHAYIDRVCRGLSAEYEIERERWRHRRESMSIGLVTSLLDGSNENFNAAEIDLGYRLRCGHLAAVVWSDVAGHDNGDDRLGRLRAATLALGHQVGAPRRPLMMARDHTTLWAWIPLDRNSGQDLPDVDVRIEQELRIALGRPAHGPDGFLTSHRQAVTAYNVGRVSRADGEQVFRYDDISGLAFLGADLEHARIWVADVLGPLATDDPRSRDLRNTLHAYITHQHSSVATARALHCHKNTVVNRIRTAEHLLGTSIAHTGANLGFALLAAHRLGPAVLHDAAARAPRPHPRSTTR